jgi:phosphatidylglycerophosphatase A
MNLLSKIISTFFGVGYFPLAPGTLTSLIVVLLYKFYLHTWSWPFYLMLLFFLFIIGTITSTQYSSDLKNKDPRNIVIDEAMGQALLLFHLGGAWFPLILSFLLFRLFDIVKPYPIKKIENFPKGWGIMMDDIAAAVYAGVLIRLYLFLT